MMYIVGKGSGRYLTSAYIDSAGIVQKRGSLSQVSRVFPTISGLWSRKLGKEDDKFLWGVSLGVNDGVTNEGAGFAVAYGLFLGLKAGTSGHFGIVFGGLHDPTVRRLPYYARPGLPYPDPEVQDFIRASRDNTAFALSKGIELPTEQVAGRYTFAGIAFSVSM
ncbi:MAG: hypothetical protein HS115_12210 [Spirochaetales bacterium]|nr:hypothetical protein [Spirochaetales bacterium]